MADKKPAKRKRKNQSEEDANLTKDEEEVAKYMRFNLESKKSTLLGDEAYFFYGSKAVDFLMDSKWATGTTKSSVAFTHRESVVAFLNKMLGNRYFDHVHVIKTEKKVKKKDGEKDKDEKKDEKEKKQEVEKKDEKNKNDKSKTDEKEEKEKKAPSSPRGKKDKEGKEVKKVKKKVKINLEPHEDQIFFDEEDEAYVWIYDPVSWKTFFFGILLVLAIIAVCLFPLWPENVREYSWYLSVAGAIFVGGILVLAVFRYIIYGFLWLCTVGKLHFWLLPNLTAECGFFESFVPAYEYSLHQSDEKEDDKKKKKRKDKSSTSDKEKSGSDADADQVESSKQNNDNVDENNDDPKLAKEQPGVEELNTEVEEEEKKLDNDNSKDSKDDLSVDVINNTIDETPEEITQTDELPFDNSDKPENESEESNGSTKEDGWVKVKKDDVSKNLSGNENEVNC